MPFNQILVGRLNRWVQKLLVIKNTALLDLSPNLQPVVETFQGVEERYLQGWTRFIASQTVNAVASQFGLMQLRNPPGSNVIAVVEKVNIMPATTTICRIFVGATSTDGATLIATSGARLDPRGNPGASSILSSGTTAGLSGTNAGFFRELAVSTLAETPFIVTDNQEIPILPGDAFLAEIELVNTQVSFSFMWRERPLESSELT